MTMTVEHISENLGPRASKIQYLDGKRKVESEDSEKKPSPAGPGDKDQVEISENAKKLMSRDVLLERMEEQARDADDIREEKIKRAEIRLMIDYYNKKEVLEKVAESLLGGAEKAEAADAESSIQRNTASDIRWDLVRQAEDRMRRGFYEDPTVIMSVVDKLLGL